MPRYEPLCLLIGLSGVLGVAGAQAAYAPDPIQPPLITLDAVSPTLPITGFSAADILSAPPPTPFVPFAALGLTDLDDLSGFSGGSGPRPDETYALLFSVERGFFVGQPPDPNLAALGYIYNAFQQAELNQAATDLFMSTSLFDNGGQVGGLRNNDNNVLVRDGGNAGGAEFGLIPNDPITVDDPNPGDQDNVDGADQVGGGLLAGVRDLNIVYYSLRRQSPSLPDLPGIGSPADIYFVDLVGGPGIPELFATAPQLGLQPADNIASLLVIRGDATPIGPFAPGDRVVFSLDENSPTLIGLDASPSDLLVATFGNPVGLYATGFELGLTPDAKLSALTYYLTDDIFRTILRHGIKNGPIVGDLDDDGDVDQGDLGILLAAWGQDDGGDINGDGDTNQADLGLLLANYGFGT